MRYNLTAFDSIFDESIPSYMEWRERLNNYFNSSVYTPRLLDEYYEILIDKIYTIHELAKTGTLTDQYSGLFSFNNPHMEGKHTFNMANYVNRNYLMFNNKNIRTVCGDYGILNTQIRMCGLNLKGATIAHDNQFGAVLVAIGNNAPPYSFKDDPNGDVVFACNVFDTEQSADKTWALLEHLVKEGKHVFFTTNTFSYLHSVVNYDRIKQMENPIDLYDDMVYSDPRLGISNKIYKLV